MPGASVYLGHEALSPSSHTSSQFSYFWTFPVDFRINERATSTSVFWKILIRKLYNECMSEALRITELFTSTFVFWSDSWRSPYKRTVPASFPFCKQIPPLFLYMQFPRRNHVRPLEILDMDYVNSKCYWMINESTNLWWILSGSIRQSTLVSLEAAVHIMFLTYGPLKWGVQWWHNLS